MPPSVDEVASLFRDRGGSQYGGECVTQLEHALQCAALAESEDAPPALIAAALLHDVGHLLHELPDDAPDQGVDDRHETSGSRLVRELFGDRVAEPIRLHVAAKRYLCAVDAEYQRGLSEPSLISLALQGGPMAPDEATRFEQHPHFEWAVRLRRWDDAAKAPERPTPAWDHYEGILRRLAAEGSRHDD